MVRSDRLFGPAIPGFAVSPTVAWRPENQASRGRRPVTLLADPADSRPGLIRRARHFTYRRAEYKHLPENFPGQVLDVLALRTSACFSSDY
jgi:hypothetical protein